jgi:hypothetical protein
MRKFFAVIFFFVLIVFLAVTYGLHEKSEATLAESKTIAKESDDFILHLQVNDDDGDAIKVLHSIQYNGKEKVELQHQAPLVSVSLLGRNHDFTGSYVKKEMEEGNIYRPQKAITLPVPEDNECHLYIKAKFLVDGKMKTIHHVEELKFQ